MTVKQIENYLTGKNLEPVPKLPTMFDKYEDSTSEVTLQRIVEARPLNIGSGSSSAGSLNSSSLNSSFETVNIADCNYESSSEESLENFSFDSETLEVVKWG